MSTISQELKLNGVSVYRIPENIIENFNISKYLAEQKGILLN